MTTAEGQHFVRQPALGSSVGAVALAVVAVAFVADTSIQRRVLIIGVLGTVAFAAGVTAYRRGDEVLGELAAIAGTVVVGIALFYGVTNPMLTVHRVELLPGLIGIWVLTAGVTPLRRGWERRLVALGATLVFLSVLGSGLVQMTDLGPLLVAAAMTFVAWDLGENAVSLGQQVGEDADTTRAELVHGAASGVVGGAAVLLVLGVNYLGVDGLPFAALAALLLAGVVLAVSHYR